MKRARTQRVCDAPGCTVPVKRGILMCRAHWFRLPRPLREAIGQAWRDRRIRDWSANCLEARGYLARADQPATNPVTPQRAYDLQARMLGERNDA